MAAPRPQAATVCRASLCPGGRGCEQVVRSGLWTPGLCGHGEWGLPCRRLHSDWPCLPEDEIHGALPSGAGSGTGAADSAGERQGPEQDRGRGGLVRRVEVQEPLCLLSHPGFSGLFKGSGTFAHTHLLGSG